MLTGLFTLEFENHLWRGGTYSYGKSLDVFILTVLDDLVQSVIVMGLSISHNDHDFFNSPSGSAGFSECLLPEVSTGKGS